jgi:hypothetical protein
MNIYLVTNTINTKPYIGQTKKPIEKRWNEHKISKYNNHFHRAIRKYRPENFIIELIEEVDENLSDKREKY